MGVMTEQCEITGKEVAFINLKQREKYYKDLKAKLRKEKAERAAKRSKE